MITKVCRAIDLEFGFESRLPAPANRENQMRPDCLQMKKRAYAIAEENQITSRNLDILQ